MSGDISAPCKPATIQHDGPRVHVDWSCGSARLEPGLRMQMAPLQLRWDVLMELREHIDHLLMDIDRDLHPERGTRLNEQRFAGNARRREICERLSGALITCAEPLVNGDVLLHLGGGQHVVAYANDEDVKLELTSSATHARRYAASHATGDHYVREAERR